MTRRNQRNNKWTWIVAVVGSIALIAGVWGLATWLVDPGDPSAFYDPPQPLPDGPPGTLIRSEPLAGADVAGAQTYRILYTSTGLGDEPIAVSGVVVVPRTKPAANAPIVAWAHGTSGIATQCAPSMEDAGNTKRIPELDQFVAAGAIVTATDYPGLGSDSGGPHPYLVGESEGRAVLDSVRAAQQLVKNEDDAKVRDLRSLAGGSRRALRGAARTRLRTGARCRRCRGDGTADRPRAADPGRRRRSTRRHPHVDGDPVVVGGVSGHARERGRQAVVSPCGREHRGPVHRDELAVAHGPAERVDPA